MNFAPLNGAKFRKYVPLKMLSGQCVIDIVHTTQCFLCMYEYIISHHKYTYTLQADKTPNHTGNTFYKLMECRVFIEIYKQK